MGRRGHLGIAAALAVVWMFVPGGITEAQPPTSCFAIPVQGSSPGRFPNWWSLRFTDVSGATTLYFEVKSAGLSFSTVRKLGAIFPAQFPAWVKSPKSGIAYQYSGVPWGDPKTTRLTATVYLVHWNEGDQGKASIPPSFPLRLKLFAKPAHKGVSTWRLTEARLLNFDVTRTTLGSRGDDVAVVPSFRIRVGNKRLIPDPFGAPAGFRFRWGNPKTPGAGIGYPGDWMLPFWAIYNKRTRTGWWFLREDHEIPHTLGPGTPYVGRPTYRDHTAAGGWEGFSPATLYLQRTGAGSSLRIQFRMTERLRLDQQPRSGASHPPPYIQSGSTRVEEIDASWPGGFTDYYDILMRYKGLVNATTLTHGGAVHSNNYQVNRRLHTGLDAAFFGPRRTPRPISRVYRDVPLAFFPRGEWYRYAQSPITAGLRMSHVSAIQRYWKNLTTRPTTLSASVAKRPGFFFHADWFGNGLGKPEHYLSMLGGYAELTAWARGGYRSGNRGFAVGFVNPAAVSTLSTRWNASAPMFDVGGNPILWTGGTPNTLAIYCWHTSLFRRAIFDPCILGGPLKPGTISTLTGTPGGLACFDGLYFDNTCPDGRCSGMNALHTHSTATRIVNEQLKGIRDRLESAYARHGKTHFFDEEVPLECHIDQFDSHAGQDYADEHNPPFFRMVYGNAGNYSLFGTGPRGQTGQIAQVDGLFPPWLDHPIYDLYRLSLLKDGGIVVVMFFDNDGVLRTTNKNRVHTHHSFMNLVNPPGEPVKPLLRSYLANFASLLKPAFNGEVVRLPKITAPPCCLRRYWMFDGKNLTADIFENDPIVKASAFRYGSVGNEKVMVLLFDWATTYQTSLITPGGPGTWHHAHFDRDMGGGLRPEDVAFVNVRVGRSVSEFKKPSHQVQVTIDPGLLGLPTHGDYVVWQYELGEVPAYETAKVHRGRFPANAATRLTVRTRASTLTALIIERP